MAATNVTRCPHCGELEHQLQADGTRECRACGFSGICSICGATFTTQDSRWAQQCSDDCAAVAAEDHRMEEAAEMEMEARWLA